MIELIGLLICVGLVAAFAIGIAQARASTLEIGEAGFDPSISWVSGRQSIAFNPDDGTIRLSNGQHASVVTGSEILEVQLDIDGAEVRSKSSAAGRGAVGGILLGPAGLIAGVLLAKKQGSISSVTLRVITSDAGKPTWRFTFLGQKSKADSFIAKAALRSAEEWYGRLLAVKAGARDELPPE